MRFTIAAVLILSVSMNTVASERETTHQRRTASVESGLPAMIFEGPPQLSELGQKNGSSGIAERMAHYAVPGASVAVVDDFALDWAKGYGLLVANSRDRVETSSLFEAGSSSKSVTALTLLFLVEHNRLDLDVDVNDYLRSWRIPDSEFTTAEKVTARRLLTHTAGINRPDGGFSSVEGEIPTTLQVLAGQSPALNAPLIVEVVPGSRHQYSNIAYVLLQQLIEDVASQSFTDFVTEKICLPFGMTLSSFDPETPVLHGGNVAWHHGPEGGIFEPDPHPSALGQGGLWTTPTDLARLLVGIMDIQRGKKQEPLSADILAEALSVQHELNPGEFFGFRGQGLGFFLLSTEQGPGFCHPGHNRPGATCVFIAFPETGQGAVVMTNGANGLLFSLELLSAIAREYNWPCIQ